MAAAGYDRHGAPAHYEMEPRSIREALPIERQVGMADGGAAARIVSHSASESLLLSSSTCRYRQVSADVVSCPVRPAKCAKVSERATAPDA